MQERLLLNPCVCVCVCSGRKWQPQKLHEYLRNWRRWRNVYTLKSCYTCSKMRAKHPIYFNLFNKRFFSSNFRPVVWCNHVLLLYICWWSMIGNMDKIPLRKSFVYSSMREQLNVVQPKTRSLPVGAPTTVFNGYFIQQATSYLFHISFLCRQNQLDRINFFLASSTCRRRCWK